MNFKKWIPNLLLILSLTALHGVWSQEANQGRFAFDNKKGDAGNLSNQMPVGGEEYWHPQLNIKPKNYLGLEGILGSKGTNSLGKKVIGEGLQYHLMSQSLAGLVNRAVKEGKSETAIWMHDISGLESYELSLKALHKMGIREIGRQTGVEIALNNYGPSKDKIVKLENIIDGYVLTDVENNPESNIVASVAAHVFNSIIVDVRDRTYYEEAGYKMTYDARLKTTRDAWNEFKNDCNNNALVVMPVETGQLREFAITNNLFVINLNKEYGNPSKGQNSKVFEEVLEWLAPNSPVYGWEQGVGEDEFVNRVSLTGNIMIPYDWAYNTSLTSLEYKERQQGKAKVFYPRSIDFEEKDRKYVSFFLSDGDNVQWMMNGFEGDDFYDHPETSKVKMSFGIPMDNLSMVAPEMAKHLLEEQKVNTTLVQTFGGGYNYADNFGKGTNRKQSLRKIAKSTAAHMGRRGIKILALMAKDVLSASSREAYQAYISANNDLTGIISVQYTPYAGGKGEIMWFQNGDGLEIPVVAVKYSIWNFGDKNRAVEGSPTYIAHRINSANDDYSLVSVHAWSTFNDIGKSSDETAENVLGGNIRGPGAAKLAMDKLHADFKVVNAEEFLWRIRMHYFPEQTETILRP